MPTSVDALARGLRRCSVCEKDRPRGWFARSGHTKAGTPQRSSTCRECKRAVDAPRAAKRRAAPGSYSAADVRAMLEKQHHRCARCSKPLYAGYHVDHVTPLSKGGTHCPANLQLLCARCNLSKGAKMVDPLDVIRCTGAI